MDPFQMSISSYYKLLLEKCFYFIWLPLEIHRFSSSYCYLFSSVMVQQVLWWMGQTTSATLKERASKCSIEGKALPRFTHLLALWQGRRTEAHNTVLTLLPHLVTLRLLRNISRSLPVNWPSFINSSVFLSECLSSSILVNSAEQCRR